MDATAAAVDAAGPPCRREGVHRLLGKRPTLVDPRTGEVRGVELFVAVLGASSFTYAEATATQQLPDWVDAHADSGADLLRGAFELSDATAHYPRMCDTGPGCA